ncbi:MAG: sigma-70 family RNA polymerase sigma factor [Limisphaerales bacterium]
MRTEMPGIENPSAQQDDATVAAVRGGDAERYRELVERHERRVFAVAWSRLGDAALAEEVTQEAFIRAYRRLWLLGDGAKFAGWVNAIARHLAINFGLRHRRELNKRKRWALENPQVSAADNAVGEPDPLYTPETLRRTLADLPNAHRECLVLFYIEGKSGTEAAAALGISEAALRVRLHRARAAMRERLEEKLEGSLVKLGPAKSLVPDVMAGVLASSSAKMATAGGTAAAGVGAKIVSVLGKTFLFSWLAPLIFLVSILPSLGLTSLLLRNDRRNFRDAGGFRPELHRRFSRSFLWGFPLVVMVMMAFSASGNAIWGINGLELALAGFALALTLMTARTLTICCNQFQVGMFAYCLIIAVGLSALALGWLPPSLANLPMLASTIVFFLVFKNRPVRMDYNLFLRAAHGLLKSLGGSNEGPQSNHFDRQALLAFARFLGSRFLVSNFCWETSGLALRLPPVGSRFLTTMGDLFTPAISRNCSRISLGWDGRVSAHCGEADVQTLSQLKTAGMTDAKDVEGLVGLIVGLAWREFRKGNPAGAEVALGQSPETDVFAVPSARSKSTRWWRIYIGASVVLMAASLSLEYWQPSGLDGLKPISITEVQVHEFLSLVSTNPNPLFATNIGGMKVHTQKGFIWDPDMALFTCMLLPETNLFTSRGLQMMHKSIFNGVDPQAQDKSRNLWLCEAPLAKRALLVGWIGWPDLNLTPEDVSKEIHQGKFHEIEFKYDYLLVRGSAWSWVENKRWDVMRANEMTLTQLRWLREVSCLDLVDRERLIAQIVSVQTLSANPSGNPPIHDWKDVRGLFFTPCWPALQDTYYSIAALEILGGLGKIDREACIEGILKRHRGKGHFTSPSSGGFNEYHIDGSARDTIAAFESLRILGALDRVKDLDKWQFRPQDRGTAKGQLTWQDVEAWVCQQRLEEILRQRRENPQTPAGSLIFGTKRKEAVGETPTAATETVALPGP